MWKKKLQDKNTSLANKVAYSDSLMMIFRTKNPDSTLYFCNKLKAYAMQAKDTSSVDWAHIHMGSIHRIKGNYDSSLYYYRKVLVSYKQTHFEEGIATIYHNIGNIYKIQSRYDLAIKNYYEALEILKNSDLYNARANIYSNFAGLYFRLENYDKAFELWTIARSFYSMGQGEREITNAHRGIARIYIEKNELNKAEAEIKKAIGIDKKNEMQVFLLDDYLLLMHIYSMKNNRQEFLKAQNFVGPKLRTLDVSLAKSHYYQFSADYELSKQNTAAAIVLYDSSLLYLDVDEVPETRLKILKSRMQAILKSGNIPGIEKKWDEIETLEKTVYALRQDRIRQETDARYNLKDKEELIGALNQRNKAINEVVIKERELKDQRGRQLIFLWLGILVVCLFAVYILLTNRKLSSTKKELEKNIEQKDFLFRELNHRVKNNLHIVSSFLGIEMHGKTEEVKDIIKTCDNRIHSLVLVHEMLYQAEIIEKVELKPYFEKLVSYISGTLASHDTHIKIIVPENLLISSSKAVLVGLIVNELLTNAIKYAKHAERALEIKILVALKGNNISIEVKDNGIGLPSDFVPGKNNSMGMKLAYGLTQQLDGKFEYTRPGEGSLFNISFEEK